MTRNELLFLAIVFYALWVQHQPERTGSFVCLAQDGSRFPWPTTQCPFANTVVNDVPYTGVPGEYTPVVF